MLKQPTTVQLVPWFDSKQSEQFMAGMNGYTTAPITTYQNEFYHGLGVCKNPKGVKSGMKTYTNTWNDGKGVKDPVKVPKSKNFIQNAIKRPGAFTKKAKAAHMGTQSFASKVSAHPDSYSTRTVRQANLAKTLSKLRKKK